MAREDFPNTYYAYTFDTNEREGGGYDPVAGAPKPYTETLTGEGYQLNSSYQIDTSEIPDFDEATETPAKLFEIVEGAEPEPEPETEMERRKRLFPNTFYSKEYGSEEVDFTYDPVVGASVYFETVTGEEYTVDDFIAKNVFGIVKAEVSGLDESAEMPAKLFEKLESDDAIEFPKFNRFYYMTPDEMREMASLFDYNDNDGFTGVGKYLINILRFPFELDPEAYSEEKEKIAFGGTSKNLKAFRLKGESFLVNFGTINVPEINGTSQDFEDAEYFLRLPYISQEMELNPQDIIGKAVRVSVAVGVYTGDATVSVYAGESETPIDVQTGKIGRKVPYLSIGDESNTGATGFNESFSEFQTPYIEARLPETISGTFANMVEKSGTLTGVSGYVEVSEHNMTLSGATASERRDVADMLTDGVIIK